MLPLIERCSALMRTRRARLIDALDRANRDGRIGRTGPGDSAHLLAELHDIDAAFARMRAGTWGSCSECGRSIGTQRLLAVPEAQKCLDCRTEEEIGPHASEHGHAHAG